MHVKIIKPRSLFGKARYQLLQYERVLNTSIPAGFITDAATTPRPLWWLLPPVSVYLEAVVLHDYLLSRGFNRLHCDNQFKEALCEYGAGCFLTNFMYIFTAMYGFFQSPIDYLTYKK